MKFSHLLSVIDRLCGGSRKYARYECFARTVDLRRETVRLIRQASIHFPRIEKKKAAYSGDTRGKHAHAYTYTRARARARISIPAVTRVELRVIPELSRFFLRNDKDNETRGFGVGMYNK